jgi:hypothetical protein
MSNFSSDVFARAMRLVVPIRREHGKSIDVQNFLHDLSYAREVLHLAINSKNEKLKESAEQLGRIVFGPNDPEFSLKSTKPSIEVLVEEGLGIDGMANADLLRAVDPHSKERAAEEDFGLN